MEPSPCGGSHPLDRGGIPTQVTQRVIVTSGSTRGRFAMQPDTRKVASRVRGTGEETRREARTIVHDIEERAKQSIEGARVSFEQMEKRAKDQLDGIERRAK